MTRESFRIRRHSMTEFEQKINDGSMMIGAIRCKKQWRAVHGGSGLSTRKKVYAQSRAQMATTITVRPKTGAGTHLHSRAPKRPTIIGPQLWQIARDIGVD